MVVIGNSDPIELNDEIGEVFSDIENLRQTLYTRASSQIDKLINAAKITVDKFYSEFKIQKNEDITRLDDELKEQGMAESYSEALEIAITESIKAKPKLAKEVREELITKGFRESDVRRAIAHMWDDGKLNVGNDQLLYPVLDDEDPDTESDKTGQMVTLPDGTLARVSSFKSNVNN